MSDNTQLRVYETRTVITKEDFTGLDSKDFYIVSGSRMLITLLVSSIDPATTVTIYVDNNFSNDEAYQTIETLTLNTADRVNKIVSDFHSLFTFRISVSGGNATFKVAVSLFDNAMTTRIDNAIISVDLHDTVDSNGNFDSVRVGDGTNLLEVNPDGSINIGSSTLPTGAATEAKQDVGNASLASIDSDIDVSLSTRASESTLSSFKTDNHTDLLAVQTKLDSIKSDLDEIALDTDNLDVALSTRASESTLQTTNTKLDTIHSDIVQVDSDLNSFASQNHTDLLAIKTDLDTIATDTSNLDVALSTRASEATLSSFESANHTDLLGIQSRQDSTNTKLDTIHADLVTIEGKQDTSNASLSSIDSKLTTTNTEIGAINETAPATDTDPSGLNGRLQRIAQRLTTIDSDLNTFASANHVDLVSIASHLSTIEGYVDGLEGLITSTNTKLDTANTHLTNLEGYVDGLEALIGTTNTEIGSTSETAPVTDTATSGLNGRLQRIAQRLTTLIAFYSSDFGASNGAIRTAALIGNSTGAADFNSGATSGQTPRTASNLYDSLGNALTSRSFDSTRPLDVYISQFRADTASRTTVTPTANTSTQLLAANSARKWVIFINNSGAPFFLALGTTATVNNGIEIAQNGGRFIMEATFLYTGAINGIVGSNSRTIEIYEAQ